MRQGYVLKKGKKFVNKTYGGYTKMIDRASVFVSKTEAINNIIDDEEIPIRVTITVEEEKS